MSGFFNNIYRLYGQDEIDPESSMPDEMEQVSFDDPFAPAEPATPRMIPPQRRQIARPGFETYLEHVRNMPQESSFEPSLGRKIAAGLVGVATGLSNPGAGYALSEQIMRSPYTRALSDWQAKGGELKNIASEEGDYVVKEMDTDVEAGKLGVRQGELTAKVDQINRNYQVAFKNAKTAAERNALTEQRNKDLKAIADAANANDAKTAGAAVTNANANATRAGAYKDYVAQGGGLSKIVPPDVNDLTTAEDTIIKEMMARDPKIREFFQIDKESGILEPIYGAWTPEQLAERDAIMAMVGSEAQKRLSGRAIGGAPPIRPPVVIPPNRRRNP